MTKRSINSQKAILEIVNENPDKSISEIRKIRMPAHHELKSENVDLKRLGSVLALTWKNQPSDFESVLLTPGLGPRTLQSLALVSEIIYGTPSRFSDPARFSFAHGGKDGHPFPVPLKIYDESIEVLKNSINRSRIGQNEKKEAFKRLHHSVQNIEKTFIPNNNFKDVIRKEREASYKYGGMSVSGPAKASITGTNGQLKLF